MIPLLIATLLFTPQARADDAPKPQSAVSDARRWLQNLREGLAESAVKKQRRHHMAGVGAAAAVRGAPQKQEDPDKPYWKGSASSKEDKQVRKESAELKKAVDLALSGKREEAGKLFDAFEAAHPKSILLGDCREARKRLAGLEPAAAPAAPAPEAKQAGEGSRAP